jgi:hypothetical protein
LPAHIADLILPPIDTIGRAICAVILLPKEARHA